MAPSLSVFRKRSHRNLVRPTISWPIGSNRPDAPPPLLEPEIQEPQLSNALDAPLQTLDASYPYHAYTTSGYVASIPCSLPCSPPALSFSSSPPVSSRPVSKLGPGRISFSDASSISSPIHDRYGEDIYRPFPPSKRIFDRCDEICCVPVSQKHDGYCDEISCVPAPQKYNGYGDEITRVPASQHHDGYCNDLCCTADSRLSAIYDKYLYELACKSFSSFDLSIYFENFAQIHKDYIESDATPSAEKWQQAAELPIFDSEGNIRTFSSLFTGPDSIGDRQLIVFVRHFYCGACQAYLRALSRAITLQQYFRLATPTSITVIGLGDPRLIPDYRQRTGCPFPIYTDPTRMLYKTLGMSWTLNLGRRVSYMENMTEVEWICGQVKQFCETESKLKFKAGNPMWIGGEFLVENGEVQWCRRMKNYRGHSDVDVVKSLLRVEE